jgi:transposase
MKAYSRDLRVRVLDALDGGMRRREVVRMFGASSPSITRWRRRRRETGSLAPSARPGPPGPLRAALRAGLPARLAAHPDATLEQHATWWEAEHGVRPSHAALSRVIVHDLGWTRKKSR